MENKFSDFLVKPDRKQLIEEAEAVVNDIPEESRLYIENILGIDIFAYTLTMLSNLKNIRHE